MSFIFLKKVIVRLNQKKFIEEKHFCMNCLQCFGSEEILTNHEKVCLKISGKESVNMPEKGSSVQCKIL